MADSDARALAIISPSAEQKTIKVRVKREANVQRPLSHTVQRARDCRQPLSEKLKLPDFKVHAITNHAAQSHSYRTFTSALPSLDAFEASHLSRKSSSVESMAT